MGYTQTQWGDGDLITAAKMNHIEEQIKWLTDNPIDPTDLNGRITSAIESLGAETLKAVTYINTDEHPEAALTEEEKNQARNNIGAISSSDLVGLTDIKVRATKNNNNNNIDYPILVSNTESESIFSGTGVEVQLNATDTKNPTINYSTGVLKATAFEGSGSGLTNISGEAINNLNANKLIGAVSTEHGGTGSSNLITARRNLEVLAATDIAPMFNSAETYHKGDYCIKEVNGRLGIYRCNDTVTGEWESVSSKWIGPVDITTIINSFSALALVQGPTENEDGTAGLVPGPLRGDEDKFLAGDGTWKEVITDINAENNLLTIAHGGTGATTSANALSNLGAVSAEDLANAISAIAEQYDENTSYNAGDYCIYNNKLYHCKAGEGITDESPDAEESEYWEEATVMNSIINVAENLNPVNIGAATAIDLAAEYLNSSSYAVGDYCIYNNRLYKCTFAIDENGEEWNSDHWQATTVDQAMTLASQAAAAAVTGVVRYDRVQDLNEAKSVARGNIGAIGIDDFANEYDPQDTYLVGSYCIHNGLLYKCITAIAVPEAWNAQHWASTTVGDLGSDIADINSRINGNGYVADVNVSGNTLTITYKNGDTEDYELSGGISFDGGFVGPDDNKLYLTLNGQEIDGYTPITLPAGGGGGGVVGYSVRIFNNSGSSKLTVASTQTTRILFTYVEYDGSEVTPVSSSVTGRLMVQYKLKNAVNWNTAITDQEITPNQQQSINVTDLLTAGDTTLIKVTCDNGRSGDDYASRSMEIEIKSVELSISTTFNSTATYKGNFSFPYTCVGRDISKVVYFYIDGVEYTHVDIGTSNNVVLSLPINLINNYQYGAHTARVWFETPEHAKSNELVFPIIYDDSSSTDPIISAIPVGTSIDQNGIATIENGEVLRLQYICYTPGQERTDSLSIEVYTETNNEVTVYYTNNLTSILNNRLETLTITQYPELGNVSIKLISGNTEVNTSFKVTEITSEYNLQPVTDGLVYEYKPTGYTNDSQNKETYSYAFTDAAGNNRHITTTFNNFNWITDGYIKYLKPKAAETDPDEFEDEALTLNDNATMQINLPILANNSFNNGIEGEGQTVLDSAENATVINSGRTIEFEFELDNVTDQNTQVFRCQNNSGVGFVITPQVCYLLASGQQVILDSTGFIENEESIPCAYLKDEKRIRVSFVIQKKTITSDQRLVSYTNIFINGEYANSYCYDLDVDYNSNAIITIGSQNCLTKLYEIRMYNRGLSKEEILQNAMNSSTDIRQRIVVNKYNDILTDNHDVSYAKAIKKYPCLLLVGRLSNSKSDKSMVGVRLTKPDGLGGYTEEFNLMEQDINSKFVSSIKVQGTSSQRFMRKNFKVYLAKLDRDENEEPKFDENDKNLVKKVKYVLKGYDTNNQPKSIGESTLCYKADYMSTDHANTFNANIADTLFNDKPTGSLVQNTIYGFRCLLFNLPSSAYNSESNDFENYPEGAILFAGDGCLNNDKGNTKTFGLETSGDAGNVTTQQKWEFKDNSNPLCTFTTDRLMEKIYNTSDNTWKRQARSGLESCYPDEGDLDDAGLEPNYDYIQLLFSWVNQRANFWDASTATHSYTYTYINNGTPVTENYTNERDYKKAIFKNEFTKHFNLEHALVYYLFIEWVALCDNRAKNMFLSCKDVTVEQLAFTDNSTSIRDLINDETGEVDISRINWNNSTFGIWYTDLYDLDSCFGAENSGYIRIPYFADWNYKLSSNNIYQFNGRLSRLWCMFEEAFATEIQARAQQLTRGSGDGTLNYNILKKVHITENAELVCPAVVNRDMEYKYEDAWTEGYIDYSEDNTPVADGVDPKLDPRWTQTNAYKYLQRGSRTEQKESFIYRRSVMLYSKYNCDQFMNDQLNFRCGADGISIPTQPNQEDDTAITLTPIQAMWVGITYGDSGTIVKSTKKMAGESATIHSPNNLQRSDNIHIHGASNLTSISSIAKFQPYEIGLTSAKKLKTLLIGSHEAGYTNGNLTGIDLSNCTLLETLNLENCTGFGNTAINMAKNTLIKHVYASGSNIPYFTFAKGGILETLQLGTPQRIVLLDQSHFNSLTYDSLNDLVYLRVENTPNTGVLNILQQKLSSLTSGIRLVGIDETVNDENYILLKMLVSSAAKGKRLDANGNLIQNEELYPIITGTIHTNAVGTRILQLLNEYYPDLTIELSQEGELVTEHSVSFLNGDGNPILDAQGDPYIQYIPSGSTAYNPITAGDIEQPELEKTAQYLYTYDGWYEYPIEEESTLYDFSTPVRGNLIIIANYTATIRRYTVTWYDYKGGSILGQPKQVNYGGVAYYDDNDPYNYPSRTSNNGKYVFKGWDKSTGYVTKDLDVYGIWELGNVLDKNTSVLLEDATPAQIYATASAVENDVTENTKLPTIWTANGDNHIMIDVGRDFNYEEITAYTLIDKTEPLYFDGTPSKVKIFDGNNGTPAIKLFDPDVSFTLAIDYELMPYLSESNNTGEENCLLCCENSSHDTTTGVRLRIKNGMCNVLWGDSSTGQNVGALNQRNMLVIRHIAGETGLHVNYNNTQMYTYVGEVGGPVTIQRNANVPVNAANEYLILGGISTQFNAAYRCKGCIYWCKIWYQNLGNRDAQALAAWPHETWRMDYTGLKKTIYNNNGISAALEFMSNHSLSLGYYDNTYNNWRDSDLRKKLLSGYTQNDRFIPGQVFMALPVEWQYIIKQVQINSIGYDNNESSVTVTTVDRIYAPSLDELRNNINFYSSNWTRIKFPGIAIDDEMVIFTVSSYINPTHYSNNYQSDPTLQVGNEGALPVESGKALWINPNAVEMPDGQQYNVGFIYFDENECAKHNIISGRSIDDQYNLTPANPAFKGKWIPALRYYTRDHYTGYGNYWQTINESGDSVWQDWSYIQKGVVFSFSV